MEAIDSDRPRKRRSKHSDESLIAAYNELGSVKKVGERLGLCGQTVHGRLQKIGVDMSRNLWTDADDSVLRARYVDYRNAGKLNDLANQMGRTKAFICRQAKALGLTDKKCVKLYARKWKGMAYEHAEVIFEAFKGCKLNVNQFCSKNGYDDLGFSRTMQEHFPDEWEHVVESKASKQSRYRLGRQVEYAVRDDLKKRGYPVVLRSPRSGGPVDVLALKSGVQLLVQAKRSMALGVDEWNTLFALANSVGAIAVLAGRPTGRGLIYKRITAIKDRSRRAQPMEDFTP